MRNKILKMIILISVVANLLIVWQVLAGPVDSPAPPNATNSYTLEDLYDRLDTGADGSQSTFTEPSVGPGTGTMHTLNEILAAAPAQDPVNGAFPSHVLAGRTYWGLGSGSRWGYFTGTRPISPLPKTGQTISYAPGDDGDLQIGEAWPVPRFTDDGDGTVIDQLTGLVWLRNANCFGARNRNQALTDANNLAAGFCGLTDGSNVGDWRLPNLYELHSLVDYTQFNPALSSGHPFIGSSSVSYWSSTSHSLGGGAGWYVNFLEGVVFVSNTTNSYAVWPVRNAI